MTQSKLPSKRFTPAIPKRNLREMSVDKLFKPIYNVRKKPYPKSRFIALKESIKSQGLRDPPEATPDGGVFKGWNRVRACKELRDEGYTQFEKIQVWVSSSSPNLQRAISLNENEGEPLTDEEVKLAIYDMADDPQKLSVRRIAELTGKPKSTVNDILNKRMLLESIEDEKLRERVDAYSNHKCNLIKRMAELYQKYSLKKNRDEVVEFALQAVIPSEVSGPGQHEKILDTIENMKTMSDKKIIKYLNKILKDAQKKEYKTVTMSVEDEIYIPFLKVGKECNVDVRDVIRESMARFAAANEAEFEQMNVDVSHIKENVGKYISKEILPEEERE